MENGIVRLCRRTRALWESLWFGERYIKNIISIIIVLKNKNICFVSSFNLDNRKDSASGTWVERVKRVLGLLFLRRSFFIAFSEQNVESCCRSCPSSLALQQRVFKRRRNSDRKTPQVSVLLGRLQEIFPSEATRADTYRRKAFQVRKLLKVSFRFEMFVETRILKMSFFSRKVANKFAIG